MSKLSVLRHFVGKQRCVLCHDSAANCTLCNACRGDIEQLYTDINTLCPRCAAVSTGGIVCGHCQLKPPPFQALWGSVYYEPPISSMLHALKYQADLSMLEPLTSLMLSHPPPWIEQVRFDAILAVPMSDTRRLEHGFNQSDEIAQYISNCYNVPLLSRHTVYRYHTAPQSTLKQLDRHRNLRKAFRVDVNVKKRNLLLIDDVTTTGATFYTLARILKQAGAGAIYCWSLARAK